MASAARKVIVTCAVTGSVHVPSQSPYLPLTPEQIAASAIGAAEAGAAILHLHAREERDGRPTPDPEVFLDFLPKIKAATNAVVNITTGGATTMSIEERLAGPVRMRPEMCSLNLGSMNFGLYPVADRVREFRYDWEPGYLEATRSGIFRNTFADIERILQTMGALGTRFEFECYDVGHLYTLAHFLDRGLVRWRCGLRGAAPKRHGEEPQTTEPQSGPAHALDCIPHPGKHPRRLRRQASSS